jgi:signal transduction histidine kinase
MTFLIIFFVLNHFNNKNKSLLRQTKDKFIPSIETIAKIKYSFNELRKTLQDVVASSGEIKLEKADSIAESLKELTFILKIYKKDTLANIFSDQFSIYYTHARKTTKEMMTESFSDSLVSEINEMIIQHKKIAQFIDKLENETRNSVVRHFYFIERNNKKAEITNFVVAFTGFIISLIISFILGNALVKPFKELNESLKNNKEELNQMNEELSSVNDNLVRRNDELKNALDMLKHTQAQLIQSERLASVGIFVAGIAHEINNPLNFIQGSKTAIENYIFENLIEHTENLMPFIDIINTGIHRASTIIERLNQFSAKGLSDVELLNVNNLIDNCILVLQDKLNSKIEIKKHYTQKSYLVLGNEGKLHQVFLSILENSIQAIENSGTISIATKVVDNKLIIEVKDTGCGIHSEDIPKIMDPFFTTKDPNKGTGLGLAIAYNIIKEHNGNIVFTSEIKKGTTVIISLPLGN